MMLAGVLFSAVAIFLGIFTKLPQGGGGLINNLMVMGCFYSAPPVLHPPPPPSALLFDLDAAILETKQYYLLHPLSTGNCTQGPMPSPVAKHRAAAYKKNPPSSNATFSLPDFSFPSFSPPSHFYQLLAMIGETVARIFTAFLTLCSPWLVARQMYLLDITVSTRKASSTPLAIATGFEQKFWQIQPYDPLFDDLKIAISERDEALVELMRITKGAKEEGKKALERDLENEESIKGLRKERDDVLVEIARGKRNSEILQKEMEDEVEGLKEEIWKQARAWEEEKKEWMEKKAEEDKKNQEEKDSLKMGRERERNSWKTQVDRLEVEKKREREDMGMKLKKASEGMKKEREKWAEEREGWKKGREEEAKKSEKIEAESKKVAEKTNEEKISWEKANDRARRRIIELENENTRLTNEASKQKKLEIERDAARKTSEEARAEEQKRREDDVRAEARSATSKLEAQVLNGRKLIEGLQSDKRRDRQLLLELRAQLIRPTHAVPPTHINPLRFGGSAQAAYEAPAVALSSATLSTNLPASPKGTLTTILPSNPPQAFLSPIPSATAVNQDVDLQLDPLPPRPIVRLPPPPPLRRIIPAQQPAPSLPPFNAPKGPKGWKPSEGPGGSQ